MSEEKEIGTTIPQQHSLSYHPGFQRFDKSIISTRVGLDGAISALQAEVSIARLAPDFLGYSGFIAAS